VTEAAKNEEPDFPEDGDIQTGDGSDIPVDIIITHIMSAGSPAESFKVNDKGSIMWTDVAAYAPPIDYCSCHSPSI
jgi:hypothetical protein